MTQVHQISFLQTDKDNFTKDSVFEPAIADIFEFLSWHKTTITWLQSLLCWLPLEKNSMNKFTVDYINLKIPYVQPKLVQLKLNVTDIQWICQPLWHPRSLISKLYIAFISKHLRLLIAHHRPFAFLQLVHTLQSFKKKVTNLCTRFLEECPHTCWRHVGGKWCKSCLIVCTING